MCRLFGLHAGERAVAATFWLLQSSDSLLAQSHHNPDGAGIGVFGLSGRPTVDKQPIAAWRDREFATAARDLRGTTFVAHVRYASTGAHVVANTHPFLLEGRLFAHNGVVLGLDELDARLVERGGAELVHGDTDSERIFALVTAETRHAGDDVTAGLAAAISRIADRLPVYSLNLVMATATDLWALRYPETHELYVLERAVGGGSASGSLHASSARINARSADLASAPAVIVASEPMDDDPGWRLMSPGELVHVSANLAVDSDVVFPTAPSRLLRLADLDPAAAASQHPADPGHG